MSDTNQICFMEVDGKIVFFNEAESVSDLDVEEPEELEISARHGKRHQANMPWIWKDFLLRK